MLEIDWTLPVALVSVIVFLFLMSKILFKPLSEFMERRDRGVEDDLAEARRLRQQAEAALTTYESSLAEARRQMAEEAITTQRTMEAQQREVVEQARGEASQIVTEAQATIARETEAARVRLVDAARHLAQLLVAKLMGREAAR
jgi:F-type H+-transporting ATPase subunit b